jgi:hypothetical protein
MILITSLIFISYIAYFVAIQFKSTFVLDRKCIANCWFKDNTWPHKIFNSPDGFIVNILTTIIAFFIVFLTFINLWTSDIKIFLGLFIAVISTILFYRLRVLPILKEERSPFFMKVSSSIFGSILGLIVLFVITLNNVPDYDVTIGIIENIDIGLNHSTAIPNDSNLLLYYIKFDTYISKFTWFGMLKLSETIDHWILIIPWIFFAFMKIGFYSAFSFIALSIIYSGRDLINIDIKSSKKDVLLIRSTSALFIISVILLYTIELNMQNILDKNTEGTKINYIDPSETIHNEIEILKKNTKSILPSVFTAMDKFNEKINPEMNVYEFDTPSKKVDKIFKDFENNLIKNIDKNLEDDAKRFQEFEERYKLKNPNPNKKVIDYIFKK